MELVVAAQRRVNLQNCWYKMIVQLCTTVKTHARFVHASYQLRGVQNKSGVSKTGLLA